MAQRGGNPNIKNFGFKPGQSGNPSGVSSASHAFRKQCREIIDTEGLEALVAIARNKETPAGTRKDIWFYICDQGYGKARTVTEVVMGGEEGTAVNTWLDAAMEAMKLAKEQGS